MTIEDVGFLILALGLCLCGILTLFWMFAYVFLARGRGNYTRRMLVCFGLVGLLIPSLLGLWSLINIVPADPVYYLWPTSFVLGAGEYGDALWYIILIFSVAIIGNIGAYGIVGFFVGWVYSRIRAKRLHDASEHSVFRQVVDIVRPLDLLRFGKQLLRSG